MQSLEKALQLKPDYPEALGVLGWDYIKVGRALDAEAIFTKKYEKNNADISAIQGLAWAKFALGKNEESEKYFKNFSRCISVTNFVWSREFSISGKVSTKIFV